MLLSLLVLWVDGTQMGAGVLLLVFLGVSPVVQLRLESRGLNWSAEMVEVLSHVVWGPFQDKLLMWLHRVPQTQKCSLPGCLMSGFWTPRTSLLVSSVLSIISYMHNGFTLLFSWNWYNIVNQLYSNFKKHKQKRKKAISTPLILEIRKEKKFPFSHFFLSTL